MATTTTEPILVDDVDLVLPYDNSGGLLIPNALSQILQITPRMQLGTNGLSEYALSDSSDPNQLISFSLIHENALRKGCSVRNTLFLLIQAVHDLHSQWQAQKRQAADATQALRISLEERDAQILVLQNEIERLQSQLERCSLKGSAIVMATFVEVEQI